jgi:thioredoxin-like negative regulator of GroEL
VLEAAGPVTVEFMSYSCAHCRAIEASLQQVAQALAANQQMVRVNVASEPALAARYGVHGTPTLVMFQNGEEVGRLEGPPPDADALLDAISSAYA